MSFPRDANATTVRFDFQILQHLYTFHAPWNGEIDLRLQPQEPLASLLSLRQLLSTLRSPNPATGPLSS